MKRVILFITLLSFVVSCKKEEGCENLELESFHFKIASVPPDRFDDIKDENGKVDSKKFCLFLYKNNKNQ